MFTFIKISTEQKYLLYVAYVVRASVRSQIFIIIKESIQKRNSINLSVIRTLVEIPYFTFTRDFTQKKNLLSVISVVRVLVGVQYFMFTRGSTQERNHISVICVVKASVRAQIYEFII